MKHIWVCQCGESGLGVEEYVKHMYLYAEIDEQLHEQTKKHNLKDLENACEELEKEKDNCIDENKKLKKALDYWRNSKKHIKKALKKGKR